MIYFDLMPISSLFFILPSVDTAGILTSSRGLRGQRVREATGILNLTIRLRSEMTDVCQAIKGDENLFLHYHMVD